MSGLALAWIGDMLEKSFAAWKSLDKANSIAALGVAVIVIYVSVQLGIRTVEALLNSAPKGMNEKLESVILSVPGIQNVHPVRIRRSGPSLFIDVHVEVDGQMPLVEKAPLD